MSQKKNLFEAMSPEEIIEVMSDISTQSVQSREGMMWRMYHSLKVGTVFKANVKFPAIRKSWLACDRFETMVMGMKVDDNLDIAREVEIFPELLLGETVMFLGMSKELYPYEWVDRNIGYIRGRKGLPQNVIRVEERKYPTWLVNEKVRTYPLDLTYFTLLVKGNGISHQEEEDLVKKDQGAQRAPG